MEQYGWCVTEENTASSLVCSFVSAVVWCVVWVCVMCDAWCEWNEAIQQLTVAEGGGGGGGVLQWRRRRTRRVLRVEGCVVYVWGLVMVLFAGCMWGL